MGSETIKDSEIERFNGKHTTGRGCWVWQGPLDKDGYGTFYFRRRNRRAHRFAWYMTNGDIPAGMVINHNCGNRACVQPQHLSLYTIAENALQDSRSLAYINSRKTHCPRGHTFDRTVTWGGKQYRICTICERDKKRRLRAKWAAETDLYAV